VSKELFFNELSTVPPAEGRRAGRERMATLVSTALAATRAGALRCLRSAEDFSAIQLAAGYSIAQWRNDHEVQKEAREYLRVLQTKYPLAGPTDIEGLRNRLELSEFSCNGTQAYGVGAAAVFGGLALSLLSAPAWDVERLSIRSVSLVEEGGLEVTELPVRHAARPETVRLHEEWLRERQVPVFTGDELWARRVALYPSLEFCKCLEAQLSRMERIHVNPVRERLDELERYFKAWDGGAFDPEQIAGKITVESTATLERYGAERTVTCPDGLRRRFSWHARATPGAIRIYFEPVHELKRAYVGYIGDKLATVKCPT
jgi:hypothetical protein